MLLNFKTLLPNKEEVRKLFFEVWKYLLLAVLGVFALLIPTIRSWLVSRFFNLWTLSKHDIVIRGWIVIALSLCAVFTVLELCRWIASLLGPAHTRRYTRGDFDGIHWTWHWRRGRVDRQSMMPFCPTCQTELLFTPRANQYDGVDTDVLCTQCNSGFGIRNVADLRDHVYRKIEGNVRTGRWKGHASKTTNQHSDPIQHAAKPAAATEQPQPARRSDKEDQILLLLTNSRRGTTRHIAREISTSLDRAELLLEDLRHAELIACQSFSRLEFEDPRPAEWRLTNDGKRYLAERNLIP